MSLRIQCSNGSYPQQLKFLFQPLVCHVETPLSAVEGVDPPLKATEDTRLLKSNLLKTDERRDVPYNRDVHIMEVSTV